MSDERSTLRDVEDAPRGRKGRWAMRLGMGLVALVAISGAVGLAGPRTGTIGGEGGGYELDVVYTSITRAGQPAPLQVRVTRPGGFDGPVSLAICDEYFDDLDFQNWYPNPSSEIGEGDALVYEYDPPVGDVLEVDLDARVSPGQFGEVDDCRLAVMEGDVEVASVTFDTWRLP